MHSTGADNQRVSLLTDLDFFLQFRKKQSVFNYTFHPLKETEVKVLLQPSALWAASELKQARMEPSELLPGMLKVSHLIPGSAGWYSHLTQESKYSGQLSISTIFVIFLPPKFINSLLQHPYTNLALLNNMLLYHHTPIGRTGCCSTHIIITPWGKNIFLILPVSLNSSAGLLLHWYKITFSFIASQVLSEQCNTS